MAAAITSKIKLKMDDARRQAPLRSPWVRSGVKVGINAEARAPPATRLKSVSATRLAALKASIWGCVPKAPATRICRTSPARLLSTKASITVPAARAICWLALGGSSLTEVDYILIWKVSENWDLAGRSPARSQFSTSFPLPCQGRGAENLRPQGADKRGDG